MVGVAKFEPLSEELKREKSVKINTEFPFKETPMVFRQEHCVVGVAKFEPLSEELKREKSVKIETEFPFKETPMVFR
ncbi:MAG: hypothetical protein Q8873_03925 [Bacillota bacterium]|nr:hypothetical protein [Bacillota bacterium]